ncbi:MAG: phosphoribosylamine--glycine ligase [Planctomycetaceae bacterium]
MTRSDRVLIVGGGGREHAIAWKLSRDGAEVFVAPGNAGTAAVATNVDVAASDIPALIAEARRLGIDLTVVGPEGPLVAGIVDAFESASLRIFGPSAKAAAIEGSKRFCKQMLHRGDVPTAMFQAFRSASAARGFVESREDAPMVVKADGLAAGKGVFVCNGREEALAALESIQADDALAAACRTILIEEKLDGTEVSVMAITDGRGIVVMPALQDHKAAWDADTGPNTGGMGAYCPTPFISPELEVEIEERILVPTIHAMKRARVPFQGVLYAGLMLTSQGPKVLEFNARFGDPECQALMVRLESSLLDLLDAAVDRRLSSMAPPVWTNRASVTVVMASEGYPGNVTPGLAIRGLEAADALTDVHVFHAGTARRDDSIVTTGGRVLGVTGLGETLPKAKLMAYTGVRQIRWKGAWCRKDIADKGIFRIREQVAQADHDGPPTAAGVAEDGSRS